MHLNAMSLADLERLRGALDTIMGAARMLSGLPQSEGHALLISLAPGQPVTILTQWAMPESDAAAPAVPSVMSAPAPQIEDAPAAFRRAVVSIPSVAPKAEKVAAPVLPAPQVSGPLTDSEKDQIQRMIAAGHKSPAIAARLNRRVQTVSLYLAHINGRGAATPKPAPKPSVTIPAVPADRASSLGSRTAEPARVVPEAHPSRAPETGPATGVAPGVATTPPGASIPADLPWRRREIRSSLRDLPARRGFDAELDLEVVEGIYKGIKAGQLALDLDLDSKDLLARFREIVGAARGGAEHLALEDQAHLVAELRHCVTEARTRAA